MQLSDYEIWATKQGIKLGEDLNIDQLGWRGGDYFKLININGQAMLVKEDALVKFIKTGNK